MMQRSLPIAAAMAMLVTPLAALGQALNGFVVTAPINQSAPALGLPLIALLAVILAGLGVYQVRRLGTEGRVGSAALIVLAGVIALAGLSYATIVTSTVTISGPQCTEEVSNHYDGFADLAVLTSECPNQIKVVDFDAMCDSGDVAAFCDLAEVPPSLPPPCEKGQILTDNESCRLPTCCAC